MGKSKDDTGSRFGMWLFLYTEIMLFGGLFIAYAVYYHRYASNFARAGRQLDTMIGTVNTVLLLASSFAVAASITAVHRNSRRAGLGFLGAALLLGAAFLMNKYFEWGHKFAEGIYPGSPELSSVPAGNEIFFGLYYTITGLHGLHVGVGLLVLSTCFLLTVQGHIRAGNDVILENSGLYWHLVDMIWIFVFPLFYLIL